MKILFFGGEGSDRGVRLRGDQGGSERRSEVFVKIQKNRGGGRGAGEGGCQGRCEWRSEVFVKNSIFFFFGGGGGGGVQVGGSAWM